MLKTKHLQPWLLIYLIVSVILLLTTVGLIVVIVLDQITGFNFISVSFYTCQISSNYKFNFFMQIILRNSFILSMLASTFALGQTGMAIFNFVKFRGRLSEKQDEDQDQTFQDLTKNKLIMLYVLNAIGLMFLTSVCGSYLSLYVQFNKCSGAQNLSSYILIPVVIAGIALLFQIVIFVILMKLFYHFNEQLQKNHGDQSSKQQNRISGKGKQNNLYTKRNMLQPKTSLNQLQMHKSKNKHYNSLSTDQQGPRDFQQNLLDRNTKNTGSPYHQNTIYGNTKKLDDEDISDDSEDINQQKIDRNSPQKNTLNPSANNPQKSQSKNENQKSANSVSAQQKQLMKKIPKYPYNKNQRKIDPSDIIFEQESSEQQGSEQNYPQSPTNMPGNQSNRFGQNESPIKKENSNTSPNHVPNNTIQQNPKEPEIIRAKYLNSPYLKNLQNKNITKQERRNIKKKHLKIHSAILEFDAKNYQVDQISDQDRLSSNISPKKSQRKTQNPKNNTSNTPEQIQQMNNHQDEQNDTSNNPNSLIYDSSLRKKAKTHRKRFSNSKSAAYILERSRIEQKKLQDQNPIHNYVQQDEGYDEHIHKVLQFDKFNRRKRKDIFNPFQEIYVQDKINEGKLYLHKNKIDRNQQKDDQVDGFDPFHDDAYEDEIYTQRQLMLEREQTPKTGLNGSNFLKIMPKQPDNIFAAVSTAIKKSTRKDGVLLDFIRSKYTMD